MTHPKTVAYADIHTLVGEALGPTDWFAIDQKRINTFADATGDHQWIHVDEDRAGRFLGSTIAHGFLTLSLIPMFGPQLLRVEGVTRGINYGVNSVRFTNMVPVNSRVCMRQTIKAVNEKAGGKQIISQCVVEIEDQERPACVAETITLLYN